MDDRSTGFSPRRELSRHWREIVGLALCVAATAGYAVYAGQDANWDQRNYHIYTVHAWLTGRQAVDLAPSQIQTWLNPAPHAIQYFLIRYLPPVAAGAAMGALAGLNAIVLWVLLMRLLKGERSRDLRWGAALAVVIALTGSVFLSFAGTTFAEYVCSVPVLAALCALIPARAGERPRATSFLVAGLLLGGACGLKLTNLIYALGMSATLLAMWPFAGFRLVAMLGFAAGGLLGFIAVGGYWAGRLWLEFGSPMFPFFNGIFQAPLYAPVNFTDARFLPPSPLGAIVSYPLAWFLGIHPTSELPFREPRFAFAAVLLPLAICATAFRRTAADVGSVGDRRDFWLLILFATFSYIIWLVQFGIQRYALPLELLTGVVALACLTRVLPTPRRAVAALTLLTVFALLWTRPPDWERVPYGPDWYGIEGIDRTGPPTLYLMMSWRPTSYAIPAFREDDVFVRLGGNMPLEPDAPLGRLALERIRGHRGPVRTLAMEPLDAGELGRLERFGGALVPASCSRFRSRMDVFETCAVQFSQLSRSLP